MVLYHGSNLEMRKPQIIKSRKLLDFGAAFYLTSDYEQAKKWEVRTTERRGKGIPMISLYNVDKKDFDHLLVLIFDAPDKEWLRCISAHRTDKSKKDLYDMLLPQKLKDQYAFKTDKALSILNFCGVKYI